MRFRRPAFVGAITVAVCLAARPADVPAQGVEISPFAGYRFGGDFFELATRQRLDPDGAPAVGAVVDVPLSGGLHVEGLVTHQEARIAAPVSPFGPVTVWRITVDHWQAGGLQEFDTGRVRPFLTGLLGLTRYAAEGDNEVRFTVGAGGGVKLFPWRPVGFRLDGRVFTTFVAADVSVGACGPGVCFVGFRTDVVWQAEFTAGLVVKIR
jgi:hypothetical protein